MPDEIPENIDLRFLAQQQQRLLAEFGEMRAELTGMREQTKLIPQIQRDVSELQIALAATRTDVGIIKQGVEDLSERMQSHGARLNAIDGRLAIIEKHTGLVKA
jgi:predicted  nucleic acid-binding Zn-ribbon protein